MTGLSNGQQAIFMLLVFILPVWVAWTANGSPTDKTSLSLVFSGSLGGILAFIKEILGGKPSETTSSTTSSTSTSPAKTQILNRSFPSKFKNFFSAFLHDTTARAPRRGGRYDPDPHRRRHRGHRKGVEPAGLKRWRLAHTGRHDPVRRVRHRFRRAKPRRYDPGIRQRYRTFIARHPRARRYGGKAEGLVNRYGTMLGAFLGGVMGLAIGYNDYNKAYGPNAGKNYLSTIIGGDMLGPTGTKIGTRTPEISKLWGTNDSLWAAPRGTVDYLKYKFLGLESNGAYKGSAWVYPFWIGLIATLAAPIARLFTSKGQRILKPLHKVGVGMLAVSTVGALALPGSPKKGDVVNMVKTPNGSYAQNPQTNMKIEGAF